MFSAEDTREDDYRDEVGRLVKAIQQIVSLTNEKRALVDELKNLASSHGYIIFSTGNHRWHNLYGFCRLLQSSPKNSLVQY